LTYLEKSVEYTIHHRFAWREKMNEQKYLTEEGLEKLKKELANLKDTGRTEIAERLQNAISQGDLSENADYTKAKEDQAFLEGRIQELEYLIKNSQIIQKNLNGNKVEVGSKVTIQEQDYPAETYDLVGAAEADPSNGRISNESPIGKAIIGAKVGDSIKANTPAGIIELKVLKIE
jgi:transcription elongation factor GreA